MIGSPRAGGYRELVSRRRADQGDPALKDGFILKNGRDPTFGAGNLRAEPRLLAGGVAPRFDQAFDVKLQTKKSGRIVEYFFFSFLMKVINPDQLVSADTSNPAL